MVNDALYFGEQQLLELYTNSMYQLPFYISSLLFLLLMAQFNVLDAIIQGACTAVTRQIIALNTLKKLGCRDCFLEVYFWPF
jgi:hypothetical protein